MQEKEAPLNKVKLAHTRT